MYESTFKTATEMDLNLHQKMGVHHLTRVLNYAPFIAEGDRATVHLTPEDWQVVADTLFQMQTPTDMLPDAIEGYQLAHENTIIELKTSEYTIELTML